MSEDSLTRNLTEDLQDLLNEQQARNAERAEQRQAAGMIVSPEGCVPSHQRLKSVDAVGDLSELEDLRQQLGEQAQQLGADLVCQVEIVSIGHGDRVLVTGLAVKTAARQAVERLEALDDTRRANLINDLNQKIDEQRSIRAEF